jgi:excisionase family DNA binding protein
MNLEDLRNLPPTISAKEVASILGIGLNQTYALAHDGEIPVLKLGRSLRFPTARILEMLGIESESRAGPPGAREGPPQGPSRNVTRQDDDFDGDASTGEPNDSGWAR